jgi:hexosaminidase
VLAALFTLLSPTIQSNTFDFEVKSQSGLTVTSNGIPLVRGSWFQYYAPGWTKGYYSSRWNAQNVDKINSDTVKVSFNGAAGKAFGGVSYKRTGNVLDVLYEFNWTGDEPAMVEVSPSMLSMSPFLSGEITTDGRTKLIPDQPLSGDSKKRQLGVGALETLLNGASLRLKLTSTSAHTNFDARGYSQDWAEKEPIIWQGVEQVTLKKGETSSVRFTYEITPNVRKSAAPREITLPLSKIDEAIVPDESIPVLIPKPKRADLDWNQTLTISNLWRFPAGRPKYFDLFRNELEKRFKLPAPGTIDERVDFDGGMSKLEKLEGGYRIRITPKSISVYGQEQEGLHNAVFRLAQMAFIKDGKVVLPIGVIDDEPRSDFRGVHLFVGPTAPAFHSKLWSNVLRPLGLNKVVLQCERTEWKTLPKVRDEMTTAQTDLIKLFDWYRKENVEPIPLIQSFGHMEWFFARGANLDLAYNRAVPYAIDPRKPEARELVGKLWDEVVAAVKPKTIHFGLDEVDMRGFEPKNPKLVTELWGQMLPYLGSVATRNNVKMMLWGDKGLAPNEAVDAAHGEDKSNAQLRRDAIPKGSYITDWHYKADQSHTPFLKSLQIWKNEGHKPIASGWYRPENVRGFYVAAGIEGAGILQTTWAGYESKEETMLENLNQFTAMVLAADYGWGHQVARLEDLPYDPAKVFAILYHPTQSPLKPESGLGIGSGSRFTTSKLQFGKLENIRLAGLLPQNFNAPREVTFKIGKTASDALLALSTMTQLRDSEKIGDLEFVYVDGSVKKETLRYGIHVRAQKDAAPIFFGQNEFGISAVRFPLIGKELRTIRFRTTNMNAGLVVEGITLLGAK